jgi:hypothetical protein
LNSGAARTLQIPPAEYYYHHMTPAQKKPMTMDKLAEIVAGGFAAVDKRLDHMDERFDAIDRAPGPDRERAHCKPSEPNRPVERYGAQARCLRENAE